MASAVERPGKTSAKYMQVCKYFLDFQNCRRGDRCKFLHSKPNQPADLGRHSGELQWVRSQSTKRLGMDFGRVLYGGEHCKLLVVGDGDFSFAAHIAESTQAQLVASCQEPSDLFHSRQAWKDYTLGQSNPLHSRSSSEFPECFILYFELSLSGQV